MNFTKGRQDRDDGLNFTAMIDVVFLLLIFFMCTASIKPPESEIRAALPGSSSSVPEFQPVKITVSAVGKRFSVECDGQLCADDAALNKLISARSQIADLPVVFTIGDEVEFDDIVHVMDICRQAGLKRIAIPTTESF